MMSSEVSDEFLKQIYSMVYSEVDRKLTTRMAEVSSEEYAQHLMAACKALDRIERSFRQSPRFVTIPKFPEDLWDLPKWMWRYLEHDMQEL